MELKSFSAFDSNAVDSYSSERKIKNNPVLIVSVSHEMYLSETEYSIMWRKASQYQYMMESDGFVQLDLSV